MEELKVGDKVYSKTYRRYGGSKIKGYDFNVVERVTKTQAVLKNGAKLRKEATTDFNRLTCYSEIKDSYNQWYIVTDEILAEFKQWKETKEINEWFEKKEFTNEEKKQIYYYFQTTLNKQV